MGCSLHKTGKGGDYLFRRARNFGFLHPNCQGASAFVGAADALGPHAVKSAVGEAKKYALRRRTVAMTGLIHRHQRLG